MLKAARGGDVVEVKKLLKNGDNVNEEDDDGVTPLHCAAHHGHLKVAQALLEARADITAKDEDGETPLDMATEKCHGAVVALLEEAPALYDAQAAAEEGLRLAIAEQAVWTAERENRY
mmetsp:Transcript_48405/g.115189  ORF Transcript_48405/g.115189 Transcript_48405/m.115189 type:complete len:118 (+) Transcript_48405:39-392(+)